MTLDQRDPLVQVVMGPDLRETLDLRGMMDHQELKDHQESKAHPEMPALRETLDPQVTRVQMVSLDPQV